MKVLDAARLYEPLLGSILKPLRQEVLKLACISKDDMLLDCCCGAGGFLKCHINNSGNVPIGIDISLSMLMQAKKNAPSAKLFCADASKLPFASKSMDVASVCMALHAMPLHVAKACLEELCRVAKRVIIADYCLTERNLYFLATSFAHTVEFLVGGEHYKCYKEFMRIGGIEGFLRQMNLEPSTRQMALGGSVLILDLEC